MKEWKKIWYRDRFFLMFLAVALIIVLMLCHATMEKYTGQVRVSEQEIELWKNAFGIELGVSDDRMHIMRTDEYGTQICDLFNYELLILYDYEMQYYDIIAAFAFTAVFLGKWILENGGRKKEFISLLPVRGRNVWIAEFLEGFVAVIVFGCFFIGDNCVHQIRLTQAYKEACAEFATLKDIANLNTVILQACKPLLLVLMIYAIFFLIKELVNIPALLIVIIPFTCLSPWILEASWCYLISAEGDMDWISLPGEWWVIPIPVMLFFVTSYILHTKKDVSSTKVFRFMAAEIVYLFLTLCLFFIIFGSGMYDWRANSLFKKILSFVLSGAVTFAVWLLAERKAASSFLPQKQSL